MFGIVPSSANIIEGKRLPSRHLSLLDCDCNLVTMCIIFPESLLHEIDLLFRAPRITFSAKHHN